MSDQLKVSGSVYKIEPVREVSDKLKVREFVIKTSETYPQFIKFDTMNDKTSLLDSIKVGQEVEVFFNLRGREWNDKVFTSLTAWRIADYVSGTKPTKEEPNDLPF